MNKIRAAIWPAILLALFIYAPVSSAQVFTNLHGFAGNTADGGFPGAVVLANGTLFGVSTTGGTNNGGTLFKVSTNGTDYSLLYQFGASSGDGVSPNEPLVIGATIFGTTSSGGADGVGTVYRVDTNGANYTVLRQFSLSGSDPQTPRAALVRSGSTLYGTSYSGGASGAGTVFKMDTNGANFAILHSFTNNPDGAYSQARLLVQDATLYGVTSSGGTNFNGTVFKLNTNGSGYSVIAHLSGGPSAGSPQAGLTMWSNVLYGVSSIGGSGFLGSVFSLATNGANFNIIHSFTNSEGLSPQGALVADAGQLYGTTIAMGKNGDGMIFRMATNGANFTIIHDFTNAVSGANPKSQLAVDGTTIFGVANGGGPAANGTLFRIQLLPIINTQPQSLVVTNGNNTAFAIATAAAESALSYQWYFNGGILAGQTANTLNLVSVTNGQAGNYTVTVTGRFGSVTSSPAVLTVLSAPVITVQPVGLTVTNGNPANFSVTAISNPQTYQWFFNTNNPLAGQTNNTFTIAITTTNDAGTYSVVIGNNIGSVTSTPALLVVSTNSKPFIFANPTNTSVILSNGVANFSVIAGGLGPLRYQWYSNSVNTAIGTALAGRTNATLSYTNVGITLSNRFYSVVITNALGKATSSPAMLTVIAAPLIVSNPQPFSLSLGATGAFNVVAIGAANLRYQWYSNSVNTAIGTALAGQTNSAYNFTAITNQNGRFYSVVVTNNFGRATSSPALFSIVSIVFTLQPSNTVVTNGSLASFVSMATGPGTLGYQWLFNTNIIIVGANSTNLVITNANLPGAYSLKVTNATSSATSSPAFLTVVSRPIMLTSAFDAASGSYSFSFVNVAGSTNRLWATTNLSDANAWRAIATNIMASNAVWNVTDPNAARTNDIRLYRFSTP